MKATGIVRRVDDLGRVVIPKELRRTLGIADGDPLEIFVSEDQIILKKYVPGCYFCEGLENVSYFHGKPVCLKCAKEIVSKQEQFVNPQ